MQQNIAELYRRYEELEQIERDASDALNAAKDAGKDQELPVPQVEGGGTKMVKEQHLWREVYALGMDCAAGLVLKEKYPRVFELYALQNKKADELREFTIRAFNIDYSKLRLSDIVRMFELLFEYRASTPVAGRGLAGRLRWLFTGK